MSANNQILIKEHKGKFYVFSNIMAESWCELDENDKPVEGRNNELSIKRADSFFNTKEEALIRAFEIDKEFDDEFEGHEYGIQFEHLCKDNAEVKIIEC